MKKVIAMVVSMMMVFATISASAETVMFYTEGGYWHVVPLEKYPQEYFYYGSSIIETYTVYGSPLTTVYDQDINLLLLVNLQASQVYAYWD